MPICFSWKDFTYADLIDLIRGAQQELERRGTLTSCKIIPFPKYKKSTYLQPVCRKKP